MRSTLNLTEPAGAAKGEAAAARAIHTAYERWISGFEEITRRARDRFERRDWRGAQADATARLSPNCPPLDGAVADVSDILETRCRQVHPLAPRGRRAISRLG